MNLKHTIIALMPSIAICAALILVVACQPAKAKCIEKGCVDHIAVAVPPESPSTPDIVKVVAVALIVGSIIQNNNNLERTNNIVHLRPDHRSLMVYIDIPFQRNR